MSPFTRALAMILALGLAGTASAEPAADATTAQPMAASEGVAAPAEMAAPEAATEGAPAAPAESAAPAAQPPATEAVGEAPGTEEAAADASAAEPTAAEAAVETPAPKPKHTVSLGPVGHDAQGSPGRLHTVASGDTLWDISDAYLGTPWVWPSIWQENAALENPHLIIPGDRLWISPTEIRRVTPAEADELLAGSPAADMGEVAYDGLPEGADIPKPPMFRYSARGGIGLVSDEQVKGAASIVDSREGDRTWFGSMDRLQVGLGAGEVEPGEQFIVFRTRERVNDPGNGRFLGWHVQLMGWVEVTEVHDEISDALVKMSFSEMQKGDRLLPRELMPLEVELRAASEELDGQIAFMPDNRVTGGGEDMVFLDTGTDAGVEVGNVFEIYRPRGDRRDQARREDVHVPAHVVGRLVVVIAFPSSSAAVIEHASTDINIGDRVRATTIELP